MVRQRIKNLILLLLVIVCIYLSSNVWMQLPEFISYNLKDDIDSEEEIPETYFWDVVKPLKNIIKYKDNYTVVYSDEHDFWSKTVYVIYDALEDFDNSNISDSAAFPLNYIKFDFVSSIPIELFVEHMEIDDLTIKESINNIKNVIIDLDNNNTLYIYNGENTIKIESDNINTNEISAIVKEMDYDKYTKYSFKEKIGEKTLRIPVPLEQTALNPVFVQSELDVFDTEAINKIAKDYFKSNYEYVRKSVEVSGKLIYMFRTEKVLKINEEGLLDFYDANIDIYNENGVYESFITALNFTEDFLGFPEYGYLSNIENIQYEGNYGYRFIFSYKILDRPILFSKVRENTALQIDVVGNKVVSYQRFIRNKDDTQMNKMNEISILPAIEVIRANLAGDDYEENMEELKPLKGDMIENISNIYLSYFDLSRITKEQVLRVVWVIEINEKSYIFNAITGRLIEEW
ncbi:hypothetical protein [Sedimentibacter sp. MB31-C6]|uniref:hypothetical protein n=1 Tax=Sedimentibacter sp. MB31-C6 TaxID=3109366 RepID=UPI002DDCD064|nr:hypothetical protein [Sedimentibacter sp. MB36-C1]WSI02894.1 hypothetical protein U8307_07505 [Sedimentibacter sp. MB36-C1]